LCLKCHTPYSSDHVSGSPDRDIFSPSSRQRNKRICSGSELSSISPPAAALDSYAVDDSMVRLCRSQPEPRLEQPSVPVASVAAAMLEEKVSFSFSQPAYLDDMLLNSQLHATQPSTQPSSQVLVCGVLTVNTFHFCNYHKHCVIFSQNTFQKLVRRMTRFFVRTSYEETVAQLCKLLDRLSYTWKITAKVVCNMHYLL